jgi:hypothetical protein
MGRWVLVKDLSMMGEGTTAAGDEEGNGEGDGVPQDVSEWIILHGGGLISGMWTYVQTSGT